MTIKEFHRYSLGKWNDVFFYQKRYGKILFSHAILCFKQSLKKPPYYKLVMKKIEEL